MGGAFEPSRSLENLAFPSHSAGRTPAIGAGTQALREAYSLEPLDKSNSSSNPIKWRPQVNDKIGIPYGPLGPLAPPRVSEENLCDENSANELWDRWQLQWCQATSSKDTQGLCSICRLNSSRVCRTERVLPPKVG